MKRAGLTPMTKVEVITTGDDLPAVLDLLTAGGAVGYTVLAVTSGRGQHGVRQGRLHFNDRATLQMALTVVPDERADALVGALLELFEERPGVLFVSDVHVSRQEHFT